VLLAAPLPDGWELNGGELAGIPILAAVVGVVLQMLITTAFLQVSRRRSLGRRP
jgi:hypothetical protein